MRNGVGVLQRDDSGVLEARFAGDQVRIQHVGQPARVLVVHQHDEADPLILVEHRVARKPSVPPGVPVVRTDGCLVDGDPEAKRNASETGDFDVRAEHLPGRGCGKPLALDSGDQELRVVLGVDVQACGDIRVARLPFR